MRPTGLLLGAFGVAFFVGCSKPTPQSERSTLSAAPGSEQIAAAADSTAAPTDDTAPVVATISDASASEVSFEVPIPRDLNLTSDETATDPEAGDADVEEDAEHEVEEESEEEVAEEEASPQYIRIKCSDGRRFRFFNRGYIEATLQRKEEDGSYVEQDFVGRRLNCSKNAISVSLKNLSEGMTYKLSLNLLNRRMESRYAGETADFVYSNGEKMNVELPLARVNRSVEVDVIFPGEGDDGEVSQDPPHDEAPEEEPADDDDGPEDEEGESEDDEEADQEEPQDDAIAQHERNKEKCAAKGRVYDYTTQKCLDARIATSYECSRDGIVGAYKVFGPLVGIVLDRLTAEGFSIDQCGELKEQPVVILSRMIKMGEGQVRFESRKICLTGSAACR